MDSFKVILSSKAQQQLSQYINYIHYTLENEIAAQSVYRDAKETIAQLSTVAGSLQYCFNEKLRANGYRAIDFNQHNYIMLYRIDGSVAYIDAIYHQKQDYENIFARGLK